MNGQNESASPKHDVSIKGRMHVDVTGVREVVSFDDNAVELITTGGRMTIEGDGMRIGVLDTDRGVVAIDGKVLALFYGDENTADGKKGIIGRLFK